MNKLNSKETRICLVRHGETDWNVQHKLQGHAQTVLNQRGREQIKLVAKQLEHSSFSMAYSSDLQRTWESAKIIAELHPCLGIQPEPKLRERNFGLWQGHFIEQLKQQYGELNDWQNINKPVVNGESLQQVLFRVNQFLEHIVRYEMGRDVLLVTHGGVLKVIYYLICHQITEVVANGAICSITWNWDTRQWHIDKWGETAHLQGNFQNRISL